MERKTIFTVVLVGAVLTLSSCRHRMSSAEIQHKLDSIAMLENKEHLKAQGIDLTSDISPIQLFYDSLSLQPLPLRYSDDYVKYLPGYKPVPSEMINFMNLEGRTAPKAIALPESVGAKLMILAADEGDGLYSLWLYSLDEEYMPVDKLCLYSINKEEAEEMSKAPKEDQFIQDFVITSDYEICLTDYSGKLVAEVEKVYHIDMARKFVEDNEIDFTSQQSP